MLQLKTPLLKKLKRLPIKRKKTSQRTRNKIRRMAK